MMSESKIKILIIEDSGLMRILLSEILRSDRSFTVVGTAKNGLDGVNKAKELKPDVIITDMIMPEYDGLFVVRALMKQMPLPILLLSSLTRASPQIFDALREGAFDFLDKPQKENIASGYPQLIQMVKEANMSDFLQIRKQSRGTNLAVHTFEPRVNYDIIAIGASTGGPGAIEFIVTNIPANLAIPVIIVQHMPERFIISFAERLAATTGLKVKVAADGEVLLPLHIYLAPGTSNIRLDRNSSISPVVRYVSDDYKEYNKPSIDCLFESVGEMYGKRAIGVVLTGMGKDGTAGLLKIRNAGGFTVTQDEASSVIYGMPKSAFESGAAMHQIPLNEIPIFIISAL